MTNLLEAEARELLTSVVESARLRHPHASITIASTLEVSIKIGPHRLVGKVTPQVVQGEACAIWMSRLTGGPAPNGPTWNARALSRDITELADILDGMMVELDGRKVWYTDAPCDYCGPRTRASCTRCGGHGRRSQ